ncbi:helix-turn-helix domain-containing protein [Elizabethkingia anophelis]|uniref:helix-turn-helix domain-containing protein n=1 Tax=Elizabethkingia anophelis TaxID=1117645 RepID=UPI0029271175|nr:MAG: transcriptional regulator [Elizabethkingia anophelis]
MVSNKVIALVCVLIVIFCKSQTDKLSIADVNLQYDEIEARDLRFREIKEIKKLYNLSISKNYQQGILRGLVAMQRHYLTIGDYDTSLNYGNKAEKLGRDLNDVKYLSIINMQKGNVFARLGMTNQGKESLDHGLRYCNRIKDEGDRSIIFSYIYATFSGLYESKMKNDSVIYFQKKALQVIEDTPNQALERVQKAKYFYLLIFNNMNMGNSYTYFFNPPQLDKAEPYFLKTLSYSKSAPQYFKPLAIDAYYSVAYFYYVKREYSKSIEFSEKLLEIESKEKDPQQRLLTYGILKDSYGALNDPSKQNKYLRLYSSLSDSLSSLNNNTVVLYSDRQKENSLGRISNLKKYILLSIIIAGIIILIAGWCFYKRNAMLKGKYLLLVSKLEKSREDKIKSAIVDIKIEDSEITKINISSDKERELLKKIDGFEASHKFLRKNLSLSYLSNLFNTNPRYLSQIIREYKGLNFNGYINQLRINYISRKLYDTAIYREYKISYLAEECGYTSPQVFINAFKKETGMTPSYFIKELKGENAI